MRTVGITIILTALGVVGCTSQASTDAEADATDAAELVDTQDNGIDDVVADTGPSDPPGLTWTSCFGRLRCTTVTVPVDYDDPSLGTIDIAVVRAPAQRTAGRIGTLFFNNGGPGASAYEAVGTGYPTIALAFPEMTRNFDVIGFDPRGIGTSAPALHCADDVLKEMLRTLDFTPDDEAERTALVSAFESFRTGCVAGASGALLPRVDSMRAARDMDRIREALGETGTVSYYGLSYGTFLGAVYASLFPTRVRAFVFDSAVRTFADLRDQARVQATAYEDSLSRFFDWCATDTTCAFRTGPDRAAIVASYDALIASLDAMTIPAGTARLTQTDALFGVVSFLRSGQFISLARALAAARNSSDGSQLLGTASPFLGRGTDGHWSNYLDALYSILAVDIGFPPDVTDASYATTLVPELSASAPRMGKFYAYFVAPPIAWRVQRIGPLPTIDAHVAPPMLVLQGMHDPATPYANAAPFLSALGNGSHLVTVDSDGHGQLTLNSCAARAAMAFFVDPTHPPATTSCPR